MEELQRKYVQLSHDFETRMKKTPKLLKNIWVYLVGQVRTQYIMDEIWNEPKELKFRRSGKTLVSFYLEPDKISTLIIFGKAEREKFEENPSVFSEYIQNIYNSNKTYHDGKWMFIDVLDLKITKDIIKMINIKKKPNRKAIPACEIACCRQSCSHCLLYGKNIEKEDQRNEVTLGFAKCYGDEGNYSQHICGGCLSTNQLAGNCKITICAKEKNISKCSDCNKLKCKTKEDFGVIAGMCTPGLSAEDVTKFIIPYIKL